jgi:hypothetical protein
MVGEADGVQVLGPDGDHGGVDRVPHGASEDYVPRCCQFVEPRQVIVPVWSILAFPSRPGLTAAPR